jgi:hypothetical protein
VTHILPIGPGAWDEATFIYNRRSNTSFNRKYPPSFGQALGEVAFADYFGLKRNHIHYSGRDPGWTFRMDDEWLVHLTFYFNSSFDSLVIRTWQPSSDIFMLGNILNKNEIEIIGWQSRTYMMSNPETKPQRLLSRAWGCTLPVSVLHSFDIFEKRFRRK